LKVETIWLEAGCVDASLAVQLHGGSGNLGVVASRIVQLELCAAGISATTASATAVGAAIQLPVLWYVLLQGGVA
jgi:hypothetical protein